MAELSVGSRIVEEINQRQDEVLQELDQLNLRIEQTLAALTGKTKGLSVASVDSLSE